VHFVWKLKIYGVLILVGEIYIKVPVNFWKPSNASLLPSKKYTYDCFLPKSERIKVTVCRDLFWATTAIKKHAFNVRIKTLPHANKGQAEGSQKRESEEDKTEKKKRRKLELYCKG
jgi:hypothetical protein